MNAKRLFTVVAVVVVTTSTFAQNENKFRIYGFADMAITKYFPKEEAFSRGLDLMDEKTNFGLDHLNLYTSFQPNDRVRFLSELSFQDKPVNYLNQPGFRFRMGGMDTVYTEPVVAEENKIMKGITIYEWGSFSVERALMSVNVNRYFNFSFGKFITPAGIWNVDHGSPVIMTVSQPTQYSHAEIYPKSQLGIMNEGTVFLGDADLAYSIYASSGRGNQSLYTPTDVSAGGQLRLRLPALDELTFGLSGYTGKVNKKVRYMVMTMDPATFEMKTSFEDVSQMVYRENVYGFDTRLSKWNATLQAELNYQQVTDYLNDDKKSGKFATYVIGSYNVFQNEAVRITPYAYWEMMRYIDPEDNPQNAASIAEMGADFLTEGYYKFMGGINFRIFTNYGIKLEYNFTRLDMPQPDPDKLNDIPGISSQFYVAF
ncbi:MAG: hypothetical protein ACOCW2_00610 [Chitinivibrionales bacterium]